MKNKILIKNVNILTMADSKENLITGDILIEDKHIKEVGTLSQPLENVEIIDGTNCVALPGLINCHTHAAMTLLRGYADDMELMPWLQEKIWPLEGKLQKEDVYWGTMLAILEMIKSGTTTFVDMYFFMEDVARAVHDSGIRAVLSRGMIGLNDNADLALTESKDLILNWQGKGEERIICMLGPHAPYTCPPDYLNKIMDLAQELKVGINIHVSETQQEFNDISKQYGKSPVKHLYDLGLFNFPVVAAHCVHLTEEDIDILAENSVGVAHNPTSNMKLASGIAPVPKLLQKGINVGIGTDGAASNNNLNMFEEMHITALLHKVNAMDPTVLPAYQVLQMGTKLGAGVLGRAEEIGTIEAGKKADIILVDINKPYLYPTHDLVANIIYSAQGTEVKTSIINGKIIMKDYELITIDEEKIKKEAQLCAKRLVQD